MAAWRRQDFTGAVEAFSRVPEDHARFLDTMVRVGEALAERAGRPELGLQLLQRAYRRAPDKQEVAYAWARAQLLARTNLSVPFQPRAHPAKVPEEFRWITNGPRFADDSRKFSRAQLEADLDYLEAMIANGYSYAERRGANWRGALDAVRASLGEQTALNTFAFRLRRAMTVFGDPHSTVHAQMTRFAPSGFLPFLPAAGAASRVLALKADRSGFLDPDCTSLAALDGQPIADWLRVAGHDVPQCSPQFRWQETVEALARVNYLRHELGLPRKSELDITLASPDGRRTKNLTLPVAAQPPAGAALPRDGATNRVIDGIGYLRLEEMAPDKKLLDRLDETMARFRQTRGLIIDVRGNSGGSQDALRTLMPYFLPPGTPLRIVNVAAYRVPVRFDHAPREGFLPAYRYLHPATASVWTDAERARIQEFLADFKPNWQGPPGHFSAWHVMAIRPETNPKAFYYDQPVIVLSDAGSFSATDNFLGALKGLPTVAILGTTSGGGSGRMAAYVLPNTRLLLTLCQMASFRWTGQLYDGAGVEPDIMVEARPTDHLAHSGDAALEAALQRLKKE
jgi:hypothetical protein